MSLYMARELATENSDIVMKQSMAITQLLNMKCAPMLSPMDVK